MTELHIHPSFCFDPLASDADSGQGSRDGLQHLLEHDRDFCKIVRTADVSDYSNKPSNDRGLLTTSFCFLFPLDMLPC